MADKQRIEKHTEGSGHGQVHYTPGLCLKELRKTSIFSVSGPRFVAGTSGIGCESAKRYLQPEGMVWLITTLVCTRVDSKSVVPRLTYYQAVRYVMSV
jgi:hypothetical protein